LTLVILSVALLGISIPLALARQNQQEAGPPAPVPSPAATAPRIPFAFSLAKIETQSTGSAGRQAAKEIAAEIQAGLSDFYDLAFLDPLGWAAQAVPSTAWDVFAATLRDRAAADADSLTLGGAGADLVSLEVGRSSLQVRVLLDPRGRPHAAMAEVAFRAVGAVASGELVKVINRASFIFRPGSGGWFIVGYPSADTSVTTVPPASSSSSASPSPATSP
jgi:hypothetical protein